MSSDQGYILFQRGHRDHPLFQEPDKLGAWLWINLAAAHTARDVPAVNGWSGELVHLEPGQLTFSIRFLAKRWRWSDKKVTRFLDALERDQLVTTATTAGATTGQTIITICNWQEIQRRVSSATTAATTATTTPTTTGATTKKKQLKQLKKNTLSAEGFDLWWRNYPRKVAKQDAKRAYANVIGAALISEPDLLAKTIAFAATWASHPVDDRKFIPYPASWLNAGRYDDEPDATANPAATLPPVNPADFSDAEWLDKLKLHRKRDEWSPSWGPRPDEPGCLVPSHLVGAPVSEGSLRAEVATPLRG